jgi:hypothetical protein
MRKTLLLLLTLTLAFSVSADDRHQSYISYDDGGTVVRSGGEREVEAHRNLPIYPGDEVETARRGRAEVMLSDGNIIGIDRATAIAFRSILDAYEGESNETVAELRFGKVAVHRTDIGRQHVRLDTAQASYVATFEAVYSVESDSRGRDRVTVFDGAVEVRTPARTTRLRRGEAATVDDEGVYDLVGNQLASADDFERWFLKRAARYGDYDNKYVDRRLSYRSDDLDTHGRWVFLTGIGWSWRPYVAVGWRPYYHGYWHHSRWGAMTWVSYDPWGWAPYHYGRWAHDPGFGWVWVPGYSYSPAWVYWMYGPTYVGWAPAGWWDCNPRYYDWAYRPYRRAGFDIGFGFHGRIRAGDIDYRPWTFVDSNTIFTSRVDRAALKTDAIKQRLSRDGDGFATVSGGPARFTREEVRDPAAAIRRRGLGNDGGGSVTGANTDLTPFIRRDPNLGTGVRDRIVGSRGNGLVNGEPTRSAGGSVAPITGGGLAPIGRGSLAPIGGGSVAPIGGSGSGTTVDRRGNDHGTSAPAQRDPVRTIGRDRGEDRDTGTAIGRDRDTSSGSGSSSTGSSWRDRVNNRGVEQPSTSDPATATPDRSATPRDNGSSWRSRGGSDSGSSTRDSGSSDVPARVIDGIGGARTVPRDNNDGGGSSSAGTRWDRGSRGSNDSGSTTRERAPSRDSGSSTRSRDSGSSSRSSGGSSAPARVERPSRSSDGGSSSGSRSSGSSGGSSTRSNDGGGSKSSGGNRESGGRIKRDN